jgi:membrane protein required for colicin V production
VSWLDWALAGVVAISVVAGMWRGLVREFIGLAGWVVAFLAAILFAGPLSAHVPEVVPTPQLRLLAGFLGLFIGTLVLATFMAILLSKLVKAIGLGGLDRSLGGLFGAARGLILVLAFALAAGFTGLPRHALWRDSASGPWLAAAALALRPWLPATLTEGLRYD